MKKFEFDELIEKAFSIGYELAQKEFAGAKTLLEMGKNSLEENAVSKEIRTPKQYRKFVGDYEFVRDHEFPWFRAKKSEGRINHFAKLRRNTSLGARTIDQVNNIKNNNLRLTPKRKEIMENAIKNREKLSKEIQKMRKKNLEDNNNDSFFKRLISW